MMIAEADLSKVLTDMETMKVWAAILSGLFLIERVWALLDRFLGRPKALRVSGSLEQSSPVATRADVDAVKKELDEATEANVAQHRASLEAGEKRVQAIAAVMEKETGEVQRSLRCLEEEVKNLTTALHEKINGVALQVAAHTAEIQAGLSADYRHDQAIEGLRAAMKTRPRG